MAAAIPRPPPRMRDCSRGARSCRCGAARAAREKCRARQSSPVVPPYLPNIMNAIDLDAYVSRSAALDVSDLPWDDIPRFAIPDAALRTLRYMQDIESHTIVYLRELLSTRAIDDPAVATFLACWSYEETLHSRVLARFLEAAGDPVVARPRSAVS